MIKKEVVLGIQTGLVNKVAAMFIQKASYYKSSIYIEKEGRKANAKSLLGVLSLSVGNQEQIEMFAEGEDEKDAIEDLASYLMGGTSEKF